MRETHRTIDRRAAAQRNICNTKKYLEPKGAAHRSLFAPFARQVWPSNLGCLYVTLVLQIARTAGILLTTPSATTTQYSPPTWRTKLKTIPAAPPRGEFVRLFSRCYKYYGAWLVSATLSLSKCTAEPLHLYQNFPLIPKKFT